MLFITGVAWLVADQLKNSPTGELWQAVGADLLMVHGGTAMIMLMMLGALISAACAAFLARQKEPYCGHRDVRIQRGLGRYGLRIVLLGRRHSAHLDERRSYRRRNLSTHRACHPHCRGPTEVDELMAATILWPPGMTRPYSRPRKDVVWIRRVMANHASFDLVLSFRC